MTQGIPYLLLGIGQVFFLALGRVSAFEILLGFGLGLVNLGSGQVFTHF